jgi:hypothetical protein
MAAPPSSSIQTTAPSTGRPPESQTGWGSVDFASHDCNWLRSGGLEGYYSTTVILIG